jgi:hypothetical protein
MSHYPYGFEASPETLDDDPWSKLNTINEYLEDCQPVPPDLALWLGHAIRYSEGDSSELLRRLGLKKRRGPPQKHSDRETLNWGKKVCDREDRGERPEAALSAVLDEYMSKYPEGISRTQLQKWGNEYRIAWEQAHCR